MTTASTVTGVPISSLATATTPLTGAELVPVVQSGVTSHTTVDDLVGGVPTAVAVALAGGQNDNVTLGLPVGRRFELTPAATATVTGFAGGADGMLIYVVNVSATDDITVLTQDAGSTAANRISQNGDTILPPGCGMTLLYSGTLSRWVRVGF